MAAGQIFVILAMNAYPGFVVFHIPAHKSENFGLFFHSRNSGAVNLPTTVAVIVYAT